MKRLGIICASIYILFYMIVPIRRVIYVWSDNLYPIYQNMMDLHRWIALLLVVIIVIIQFKNPFTILWDWVASIKVLNLIGITGLVICLCLTLFKIPGIWWTWLSFGLMISLLMLTVNLLDGKVLKGEALLIGVAIVFFVIGFWETIYQSLNYWLVYHIHYPISAWIKEIYIEVPFIASGLIIMIYYIVIYRKHFSFDKITLVLWGFMGICLVAWVLMGYWIDIYFDPVKNEWLYSEGNASGLFQLQLAKGSKALLGLSLIYLMRGIR